MRNIFLLTFLFCLSLKAQNSCGKEYVIDICDITNFNGIENGQVSLEKLYEDKSKIDLGEGVWKEVEAYNYSLIDQDKGLVNIWNLPRAAYEGKNGYVFEFYNKKCGEKNPAVTITLKLAAFSGIEKGKGKEVDLRLCYSKFDQFCAPPAYDLRSALKANPSAHKNGKWVYMSTDGKAGTFEKLVGDHSFQAKVAYTPGGNLIDKEYFNFKYIVKSDVCSKKEVSVTDVKVALVRGVSAGFSSYSFICEDQLKFETDYDKTIDLRDDKYLIHEDEEGYWEDKKLADDPSQNSINLKKLYKKLVSEKPRFGAKLFSYKYIVKDRSNLCGDDISEVSFLITEKIRPFKSKSGEEGLKFCVGDKKLSKINLYEELEFVKENGVLYDYPDRNSGGYWSFFPEMPPLLGAQFAEKNPEWVYNSKLGLICENPKTVLDLSFMSNKDAKKYFFKYSVSIDYNKNKGDTLVVDSDKKQGCKDQVYKSDCNELEEAVVGINVVANAYAGENTTVDRCESDFGKKINLLNLLESAAGQKIDPIGFWTDSSGKVVTSPIQKPVLIKTNKVNLKYKYTTTNPNKCNDTSELNLTIYKSNSSGSGKSLVVCGNRGKFNLFEELLGKPTSNGIWTLPRGTKTSSHILNLDSKDIEKGSYKYTVPAVTNSKGQVICKSSSAVISIIKKDVYAGEDTFGLVYCGSTAKSFDLLSMLKSDDSKKINRTGFWTDESNGKVVSNFFRPRLAQNENEFTLKYTVTTDECTDESKLVFKVIKKSNAGTDSSVVLCHDSKNTKLISLLGGEPTTNGFWTLPDGSKTTSSDLIFDPKKHKSGKYRYTTNEVLEPNGEVACSSETSVLSIKIEKNYAGEDTSGLVFCEDDFEKGLDLFSLLKKDDSKEIDKNGTWYDVKTKQTVSKKFAKSITKNTDFCLKYVVGSESCKESALLNFKVYKSISSGISNNVKLCKSDTTQVNLFKALKGNPSVKGTWIYPDGKKHNNNNLNVSGSSAKSGDYIYEVPAVLDQLGNEVCSKKQTIVVVEVQEIPNAGKDVTRKVCVNNGPVDLKEFLDGNNDDTGLFYDKDNNKVSSLYDVSNLKDMVTLIYKIPAQVCDGDEAKITLIPSEPAIPKAKNQQFCAVKKFPTIQNLKASGATNYQWYETEFGEDPLDIDVILKDNKFYYVGTTDETTGCKSKRKKVLVTFLPFDEHGCDGCVVSILTVNGDSVNDTFDLFNLPIIYPNYTLEIYNRYGVLVFKGDANKPGFLGFSNIPKSVDNGSALPTGVYFYIFYPNDNKTKPIQCDFYLGR